MALSVFEISSNVSINQYSGIWNFCLNLCYFSVQLSPFLCCHVNSSLLILSGTQLPFPLPVFCLGSSSLNCGLEILSWQWARMFTTGLTSFVSHLSGITLFGCQMSSTLIWYFYSWYFLQMGKSSSCYFIWPDAEVTADLNNEDGA